MNFEQMLKDINEGVTATLTKTKGLEEGFTQLNTRVKDLEEKVKQRAAPYPAADQGRKFSFQRAIAAIARKDREVAPFEWDVMRDAAKLRGQQRDLSTDVDTAGGFIVPEQYIADLIELLRAKTVVREMGATVLSGLTGSPVRIPRQTGGATGFWVGENSDITESQQTIGSIEMRPHEAGAITVLSNQLLMLSNPSAEAMVRNDLAAVLARLTDLAALRGTGAANEPLGIANTPSINTLVINGIPNIDNLYNMIYEVEQDNADAGALGWVFHPRTWNTLRQIKDAEGRYILTPNAATVQPTAERRSGQSGSLLGYPFRTTTQIPINLTADNESEVYFGNWSDLMIAEWGGLSILASQETSDAFQKNQTWVRIITLLDTAVRHAESFVLSNDVQA